VAAAYHLAAGGRDAIAAQPVVRGWEPQGRDTHHPITAVMDLGGHAQTKTRHSVAVLHCPENWTLEPASIPRFAARNTSPPPPHLSAALPISFQAEECFWKLQTSAFCHPAMRFAPHSGFGIGISDC
jgi:hypothetical protein